MTISRAPADREARKNIVDVGRNHPQGSTAILYMNRKCGGKDLRSVETTYKDVEKVFVGCSDIHFRFVSSTNEIKF